MQELILSNDFAFDPVARTCQFGNIDEQLARVIQFNDNFDASDFEEDMADDTYYVIQDAVEYALEAMGFGMGAGDLGKNLVDAVYENIRKKVCGE